MRQTSVAAFVALFILSLVSNLLMLTGPLFMLQVYDRVLASRSADADCAGPDRRSRSTPSTRVDRIPARAHGCLVLANVIDQLMSATLLASRRPRYAARHAARLDPDARPGRPARLRQRHAGPVPLLDLPWVPLYLIVVFAFHPVSAGWRIGGGLRHQLLMMLVDELDAPGR